MRFVLKFIYYFVSIPILFGVLTMPIILIWGQIPIIWIPIGFLVASLLAVAWLQMMKNIFGKKPQQSQRQPSQALPLPYQQPAYQQPTYQSQPLPYQQPQQPVPPTARVDPQMQAYVAQAFAQHPQQPAYQQPIGFAVPQQAAYQPPQPSETMRLEQSIKDSAAALDHEGFETWVAQMLVYLGWQNVQRVGGGRDRGVDIRGTFNGEKCIVQCKHYNGRLVPPNEVRALVGTLSIQKAKRGYLITSGRFGHQCFAEAHKRPVELWDLDTLAIHVRNKQLD
jgi:hypothetical protein